MFNEDVSFDDLADLRQEVKDILQLITNVSEGQDKIQRVSDLHTAISNLNSKANELLLIQDDDDWDEHHAFRLADLARLDDYEDDQSDRPRLPIMFKPTTWVDSRPQNSPIHVRMTIEVCQWNEKSTEPKKYAVRCIGARLSKDGKWYHEPLPSSRSDAFIDACSFTSFVDAESAASLFDNGTQGIEVLSWNDAK